MKKATMICLAFVLTAVPAHSASLGHALGECARIIADRLGVSNAGEIPVVKNWGQGNEFWFSWPRGQFSLKSLLGEVPISASCGGRLEPFRMDWVTINGKDVL